MAQFNYEQYAAQQAARKTSGNSNGGSGTRTEVHFVGEFIKNDGDVAIVRFPYTSMSDITFETTHPVDYPGSKYKKRVSCNGENCPICESGVKIDTRVFIKCLVYVADDNGNLAKYNAVWDRPSAFADIEIKNLINEYGDLTKCLFKIRRNGTGTATRYTISIVLPNNSIYNDTTCSADFTELNGVNPAIMLCKTIAQYNQAMNPSTAANASTAAESAATPAVTSTSNPPAAFNNPVTQEENPVQPSTPAFAQTAAPVNTTAAASVAATTTTPAAQPERQQRRYQF